MVGNLHGKYSIVGVGETPYRRYAPGEAPNTSEMAATAITRAVADAGLSLDDVDGLMCYHHSDSTETGSVASTLGLELDSFIDLTGGGSSIETLLTMAIGILEGGSATTIVIYRAMHGYSGKRIGLGTGVPEVANGLMPAYGAISAGQKFSPVFQRYLLETGASREQIAHVKEAHSFHASANPRALYPDHVGVDKVLASRTIIEPVLNLLDCCVESDSATAIVITSTERARDLSHRPVKILAALGRVSRPVPEYYYWGEMTSIPARRARAKLFDLAGVTPDDIDVTAAYDAFTYTTTMLLEAWGFAEPGGGPEYVSSGAIKLGGRRPNNTSGGQLCEGYTHGVSLVIENVRQLRWEADDYCESGEHTYAYGPAGCRQARQPRLAMNMGWRNPGSQTAVVLERDER